MHIAALVAETARLKAELSRRQVQITGLRIRLDLANTTNTHLQPPQQSRRPRHCRCCGQDHSDSRGCGRLHVCLAGTCTSDSS